MPPTLADRVRHILEAIEDIERALAEKSLESYANDRMLGAAIERLLEIVCEASRQIPADAKSSEPNIDWQRMIDFGNRIRHAYHRIDAEIVWHIVINDLPPLKAFVVQIIRNSEST